MPDDGPLPAPAPLLARLRQSGARWGANDCIAGHLRPGDLDAMQTKAEAHIEGLLDALGIDRENDPNSQDTAGRVARMFIQEVYAGRYQDAPRLTDFPNATGLDECYVVGPISIRSCCAHHMVPIMGHAWVGVIPGERVIGLSKFHRLAGWVFARGQIQEEATQQLADVIEDAIKPKALAVIVRANHLCCGWRGVRDEGSLMTTSVMRGAFRDNDAARREFFSLAHAQGLR